MPRNKFDQPGPVAMHALRQAHQPYSGGYLDNTPKTAYGKVIQWRPDEWSGDVALFQGGRVRHCKITCIPLSSTDGVGLLPGFTNYNQDVGPEGSMDVPLFSGHDICAKVEWPQGLASAPTIAGLFPPETFQASFDPAAYPNMMIQTLGKGGNFEIDGRGQLVIWLAGGNYIVNSPFVVTPVASTYAQKNVDKSYAPNTGGSSSNIGMGTAQGSRFTAQLTGVVDIVSSQSQAINIASAGAVNITSQMPVYINGIAFNTHVHDTEQGTSGPPHNLCPLPPPTLYSYTKARNSSYPGYSLSI